MGVHNSLLALAEALATNAGHGRLQFGFHRVAARLSRRFSPQVATAWMSALTRFQGGIDERALRAALASGTILQAEAAVQASRFGQMMRGLESPLTRASRTTGIASAQILNEAGFPLQFNAAHPNVIAFARDQTAQLVVAIQDDVRQAVQTVIALGAQEGLNIVQQATAIRQIVGLPPSHLNAPLNLASEIRTGNVGTATRRRLSAADKQQIRSRISKGTVDEVFVAKMQGKYAASLLNRRAQTIARTESLRAANAGQQESWTQASSQGVLPPGTRRFWIVTPDERLSPEHSTIPQMNLEGRRIDEEFETTEGPFLFPPSRPNCRCGVGLGFGPAMPATPTPPTTRRRTAPRVRKKRAPKKAIPTAKATPPLEPAPAPTTGPLARKVAPTPPPPPPEPVGIVPANAGPIRHTARLPDDMFKLTQAPLEELKREAKRVGVTLRNKSLGDAANREAMALSVRGAHEVSNLGFKLDGLSISTVDSFGAGTTRMGEFARLPRGKGAISIRSQGFHKWKQIVERTTFGRQPWWASDSIGTMVHHEFGHALHVRSAGFARYNTMRARVLRPLRTVGPGELERESASTVWGRITSGPGRLKDFTQETAQRVAGKVSRYGATQPVEFIAETFAGLVNGTVYADDVLVLYQALKGPIAPRWRPMFNAARKAFKARK